MNKKKIPVYILLGLNIVGLITNIVISLTYTKDYSIEVLTGYIILVLFSLFLAFYIGNTNKEKYLNLNISLSFLILYNVLLLNSSLGFINISYFKKMPNFSNKSYTEVVKWASSNNIVVNETYEYSDITKEYYVIYQDVEAGKTLNNIDVLNIVVSSGKNPEKELMIPDMTGYTLDKVLTYIEKNNLTNVKIEYEDSQIKEDDLIRQSKIGSMKRNEEIVFTFSRGSIKLNDEITLIDFTNMSKLRAIAYFAKYGINYEFSEEHSNTIKKGYIISQSIKKGEKIKRNEQKINLVVSKGNKIKVPDINKMSLEELTKWATKNNIKLEINKKYDDTIKEGNIISSSIKSGEYISDGDTLTITISKGKIVMQEFNEVTKFEEWANKYGITYSIEYEFSDTIENGKIISFSHKKGDIIKNNDTITVTVSNGEKTSVPNFIGMSMNSIISKCKNINLNCVFQYQNSTTEKNTAIRQSLAAGSEVAKDATISVILSNGKTVSNNTTNKQQSSNNNSNSNNNNSSSNNNSSTQEVSCDVKTLTLGRDLNNIFSNPDSYQSTVDKLNSYFSNINVKLNILSDGSSTKSPGSFVSGIGPGSTVTTCCPNNCKVYSITIAK